MIAAINIKHSLDSCCNQEMWFDFANDRLVINGEREFDFERKATPGVDAATAFIQSFAIEITNVIK